MAPVIVPTDVHRDYLRLLDGRDPLGLTDFAGEGSRRDVVELVLLQQALHRGGYRQELRFTFAESYRRISEELVAGRAAVTGTSMWATDLAELGDVVAASPPVVRRGEFLAGLYTAPGRREALEGLAVSDLCTLSVVSNRDWTVDWRTLEAIGFERRMETKTWLTMVRMVSGGRCDLLLAPFQPTSGLVLEVEGERLVPVRGVAVALDGSRHFAASAAWDRDGALRAALARGLAALERDGRIHAAYTQCGFFNPAVAGWERLGGE